MMKPRPIPSPDDVLRRMLNTPPRRTAKGKTSKNAQKRRSGKPRS